MSKPDHGTVEFETPLPPPPRPLEKARTPAPAPPANPRRLSGDQGMWGSYLGQIASARNLRPPGNR